MTIEDLVAFVTIYQQKNISKAAYELNITQSALSKRIKAIENELKANLLDTQNKRKLSVTPAGELFYQYALKSTTQFLQFKNKLAQQQNLANKTIRLGTIPILGQYGLTSLLANFQNNYPDTTLEIIEQQGATLLTLLQENKIDVAILRDTQSQKLNSINYVHIPISLDELLIVLSTQNKLARQITLKINDLTNQKIASLIEGSGVYEPIIKLFSSQKLIPKIVFQSSHIETLLSTVKSTNSISLLFKQSVTPFISDSFTTRSLNPKFYSKLELIYKKTASDSHPCICNLGLFLQKHTP